VLALLLFGLCFAGLGLSIYPYVVPVEVTLWEAAAGLYRLTFDMTGYQGLSGAEPPFYPEITGSFRVDEGGEHYHMPIVVSPYNYSTYRGN
jgi:5-hydroxyisourate hydrolase-like protein (transthyretin family)